MTDWCCLLVTGSRSIDPFVRGLLRVELDVRLARAAERDQGLIVKQGACPSGVDYETRLWAREVIVEGWAVDLRNYPAEDYGRWPQCGPARHSVMVNEQPLVDECLAIVGPCLKSDCRKPKPHGSHGATDCADKAEAAGIEVDRWDLWKD